MNPVAIFRHLAHEGAGYFADILKVQKIPFQLISIDVGDAIPSDASAYSGLVFMGGSMSVNDDLSWVGEELALIRNAVANDIPVLGHCLGAQLIAKALGGMVSANPVKEIGWGKVSVSNNAAARNWFGDVPTFQAFHWHGETFSLPQGATHLLASEFCFNQAFSVGKHLGLQCHIEMSAEMIETWCQYGAKEILLSGDSSAVQSIEMIQSQSRVHLLALKRVANHVYGTWLKGLVVK